jgi:hypothetical protein
LSIWSGSCLWFLFESFLQGRAFFPTLVERGPLSMGGISEALYSRESVDIYILLLNAEREKMRGKRWMADDSNKGIGIESTG